MPPDAALTDTPRPQGPDDARPLFLNADFNPPDDWWLDLGRVDFPA